MKRTKKTCFPVARKAYTAVIKALTTMPAGKPMTARQICGEAFWSTLDNDQRRFAGQFIKSAVNSGLFGLTACGPDGSNHLRYRRD